MIASLRCGVGGLIVKCVLTADNWRSAYRNDYLKYKTLLLCENI